MKEDFILVIGYPRSGSYYFSSILSEKFNIAFPIENKLILEFENYKFLWGDLKKPQNVINLLSCMSIYLKIWIIFGIKPKNIKKHFNHSIAISIPSLIKKIKKKEIIINNYKDIIFSLYREFANKKNFIYFGEKEANFYFKPLNRYQQTLGNIKIIYLIRDSRYVFSSLKKVWFGTKSPYLFSKLWNNHVDNLKKFKHKKNILVIRYEDLLTKKNLIKIKIKKFLNIKKLTENKSRILAKTISKLNTHKKLNNLNFINKKKLDIDKKEIGIIERATKKNLKYFKYKVFSSKMSIKDKICYFFSIDLGKNSLARIIFFFLPLFLSIILFFKIKKS